MSSPHVTTLTRTFDPEQIADIYARNAAPEAFAFSMPDAAELAGYQDSETARVILAEYSKTVIGVAVLTFPPQPSEIEVVPWFAQEGIAVVSRLVVEPDLRAVGVGAQLLDCAARTAARMGATTMGTAFLASQGDFMDALIRRGYAPAARMKHKDQDLVALRRPLDGMGAEAA